MRPKGFPVRAEASLVALLWAAVTAGACGARVEPLASLGAGGTGGTPDFGNDGGRFSIPPPTPSGGSPSATGGSTHGICRDVRRLGATDTLIADFECGSDDTDYGFFPINDWPHGAYLYFDDSRPNTITVDGGLGSPGYESARGLFLEMTKPSQNWGAGMGIWAGTGEPGFCVDASRFQGIGFWARGSSLAGQVSVAVHTLDSMPTDMGGGCAYGDECVPYSKTLALTDDWTEHRLSFASFALPNVFGAVALDPAKLQGGMNLHVPTWADPETIELWIDNVEFYDGPSELPRACAEPYYPAGGAAGAGGAG